MKCDAFWGLDGPPNKYIVEFSKKEVEELLLMSSNKEAEYFGQKVWEKLVSEYNKHEGVDK